MKKQIFLFLMLNVFNSVLAGELSSSWLITNGFRGTARVEYVSPPPENMRITLKTIAPSDGPKHVLDTLFNAHNAKALLAAKGNDLFYERYSFGVGRRAAPLGFSMSKSLVALTVGRALCDGHINSLDDLVKKYVPELATTSWGESTIKNVLKMSSGASTTHLSGSGWKSFETAEENRLIFDGKLYADFTDLMKRNDDKEAGQGEKFNYNNYDTLALSLVVQNSAKMSFSEFFQKTVWSDAGAESRGSWIINGKKQVSAYQGFSATPQDWIRIGIMVLRELKSDTCYGKYLKEATSEQIKAYFHSSGYGYQIWQNCALDVDFCFVGYGGQFLLFNIEHDVVVYHHATTTSTSVWSAPHMMSGLIYGLVNNGSGRR